MQIVLDPELKNELQRKAKRFELLNEPVYSNVIDCITLLTQEKATALTTLERLRNEFAVAKLQIRQRIAELITDPDGRELVGVFSL